MPQAIEAVYPETEVQQRIIHQIRNTTKFVSYKEIKPLMADLKRVYAAPTEEIALAELDGFDEKWSRKYPKIAKSWKDNRSSSRVGEDSLSVRNIFRRTLILIIG